MYARPIRSSLGSDPNGSAPVCTGPKPSADLLVVASIDRVGIMGALVESLRYI